MVQSQDAQKKIRRNADKLNFKSENYRDDYRKIFKGKGGLSGREK